MRTVGEGNLKKVLWFLGAAVIALFVLTWLEPFTQSYEIKTATKLLCSDMILNERVAKASASGGQVGVDDDKRAREKFIQRARQAGVRYDAGDFDVDCGDYLDKDEPHCFSYSYRFDQQSDQHVCTIHARYGTDTPPALIGQVLQEMPHLKMRQHVNVEQRVSKNF